MATDELEREGFNLVPIPPDIRERMKEFIDLANSMLRNPIDVSPVATIDGFEMLLGSDKRQPSEILREKATTDLGGNWGRLIQVLKDWPGLDLVVFHHGFDVSPIQVSELSANGVVGPMILAAKSCDLPKAVVLHSMGNDGTWKASAGIRALAVEFGLPIFLSMRGAAVAIRKLIDFNRRYPERLAGIQK